MRAICEVTQNTKENPETEGQIVPGPGVLAGPSEALDASLGLEVYLIILFVALLFSVAKIAQSKAGKRALSPLKRPLVSNLVVKVKAQGIHSIALEKKMTTRY